MNVEDQQSPEESVADQRGIVEEPGQAEEELSRQFSLGEPGISGVIVDRTITMTGKTFFRQFSQLSLDRPVIGNANLAIHERPSARWGSQIWITEGNRIIFEATMPPRLSEIDDYVEIAIEQVENLVIQRTIMQALENDPDLADEEI
ncbi:CsgE family curli-type amyloid fiber assembly protein [Halomonas sp. MA07-2]|uniref:CsgE family curli-type amyloid fiber assembly protein n=1 Tax=unclassified Halomonas TaxID=2609666 RepID=UPI003EE82899